MLSKSLKMNFVFCVLPNTSYLFLLKRKAFYINAKYTCKRSKEKKKERKREKEKNESRANSSSPV